jgi:mRNA-degrading endonuclease toxin of MazEF toxin-antitoxin module
LVVPLTTSLDGANLAGTALISSSSAGGPPEDSVALAFQMRAIPKSALQIKIRDLDDSEMEELELATDGADRICVPLREADPRLSAGALSATDAF